MYGAGVRSGLAWDASPQRDESRSYAPVSFRYFDACGVLFAGILQASRERA